MNNKIGYDLAEMRRNVVELPSSQTRIAPFKIDILNKMISDIVISDTMCLLSPLRIYIRVLNSRKTRACSIRTIESELYFFKRIITYLSTVESLEYRLNDRALLTSDYKKWLVEQEYSEATVVATYNHLITTIRKGCADKKNHDLRDDLVLWLKNQKQNRQLDTQGNLTLESIYPELEIDSDDEELLTGCKQVMIWILNEYQNIRNHINADAPDQLKKVQHFLLENELEPENLRYFYHYSWQKGVHPNDKVIVALVNSILKHNDSVANELMFVQFIGFNKFYKDYVEGQCIYTRSEILEYFSELQTGRACISGRGENGQLDYFKAIYSGLNKRLKRNERNMTNFPSVSFPFFPTIDETLAMEWLLACDRVQTEGLRKLNIKDNVLLNETRKTIQFINIVKNRSNQPQKTPVYHNESNYRTHEAWVNLIIEAEKYIKDLNGKYIPEIPRASEKRRSQRDFHLLRMTFWLICTEGTYANQRIVDKFKGTKVDKPVSGFIKLLRHHLMDVKNTADIKSKISHDRNQKGIRSPRRSKGEIGQLGIGVRSIAQTRSVIDDDLQFGHLVGHNKKTHENVYRNRSKSSKVNAESRTWAADVGNKMIADAERLFRGVTFLSVKEIKKILQIYDYEDSENQDEIQSILNRAECEGYVTELTTELKKLDRVYIISTPWTAALIKAQVKNISLELEKFESSNPVKRVQLQTRQIYLGLILERFSSRIIEKADQILEEYSIPFPRMV